MSDPGPDPTENDPADHDVAEAEADAITDETSAEQIKPDTELVAPTTDEAAADQ